MSRYETDDEQLNQLKEWWKKNGTQTLSAILVVTAVFSGWKYWTNTQYVSAANASAVFEQLQVMYDQDKFGEVSREALKLMQEEPQSPYSASAALLHAKYSFNKADYEDAQTQLNWVLANSQNAEFKATALLHLSEISIQQEKYEDALSFAAQVAKLPNVDSAMVAQADYKTGLVNLLQNQLDEARTAFGKVVNNSQVNDELRSIAQLQLDDLAS